LLFSVCIPVRNDLKNLKRCLSALASQDLSDCEVLVCDDGSEPPVTPSDLQETGAVFTLVTYLFFMDADTVASSELISKARQVVADHPEISVFYGSYDDQPDSKSIVSDYRNLLHHFTHHQSAKKMERVTTFWCGCGVISRDLYLRFGGLSEAYDTPSIEDIELGTRLSAHGIAIRIFPQMQVKHLKKWTVKNWLYTDLFRRGIPWVRLMRASKQWSSQLNFSWAQRIASLAAVACVLSLPLTALEPLFGLAGALSLGIFLKLNWPFFDLIWKKRGFFTALVVIPLHLAYALVCVLSVAAALLYPPLKLPPTPRLQPLQEP
jgi:GT2 family glycosyltransferase